MDPSFHTSTKESSGSQPDNIIELPTTYLVPVSHMTLVTRRSQLPYAAV